MAFLIAYLIIGLIAALQIWVEENPSFWASIVLFAAMPVCWLPFLALIWRTSDGLRDNEYHRKMLARQQQDFKLYGC